MKENICTIPINDIFRETKGCPICRMYSILESQYVEFITGSAMMAPDVRVKTNKTGFCHRHLTMMVKTGPRLSNALLLQTHLDEIRNTLLPKKGEPDRKMLAGISQLKRSCYVCDRIEADILHLLKTVFAQYGIDEEFRKLYSEQEYICLEHYALILSSASKKTIDRKFFSDFVEATNRLCKGHIDKLYDDVTHFTTMFDYRNTGKDFKGSETAIERSIEFLSGSEK